MVAAETILYNFGRLSNIDLLKNDKFFFMLMKVLIQTLPPDMQAPLYWLQPIYSDWVHTTLLHTI